MYPAELIEFTEEEWRFWDVIIKAQQGDQAAVRELRRSQNAKLLPKFGDMGAIVKRQICEAACGEWSVIAVAMYRKLEAIARDLAGPSPSAVEAMLADLAAIAWGDYQRCAKDREWLGDCSFRKGTYYDQRTDRAHKRLVRSLRALAAVRKVDLTAVQINLNSVAGQIGDPPSRRAQRAEESLVDEPILAD
jgi:hypothetical protein